jgi:hypothetical protein
MVLKVWKGKVDRCRWSMSTVRATHLVGFWSRSGELCELDYPSFRILNDIDLVMIVCYSFFFQTHRPLDEIDFVSFFTYGL